LLTSEKGENLPRVQGKAVLSLSLTHGEGGGRLERSEQLSEASFRKTISRCIGRTKFRRGEIEKKKKRKNYRKEIKRGNSPKLGKTSIRRERFPGRAE